MTKLVRFLGPAIVLTSLLPAAGDAQIDPTVRYCSSGALITCASVKLTVMGTSVFFQIKNISSGISATDPLGYRNTIFYQVGLRNVPATSFTTNGPMVTGPSYLGTTAPASSSWVVTGNNSTGAGITLSNTSTGSATKANGIASNCATVIPGGTRLWMTANPLPCPTTNVVRNPILNQGWTQFNFQVSQTWNPATTDLVIQAIDDQNRLYEINTTGLIVTPEPASLILLVTGLAGLGGIQRMRRRRKHSD